MKNDMSVHVYISNNKIQVLLGSYVKNRLQVQSVCEEPLEEGCILNGIIMNAFSLQNTITQMWQKYNLPSKGVHLVVNGSSVTVKPMKIPQTAPKNIPGLIRTEFRDMENIQNLIVDYSVTNLRNPDGTCSILAVLSTKEFIMSYVNLFKEAKIDLEVIDLVQNCLIKLMKRFKSLQGKTYAVFILDKNMLMQCLFSNDNFVMTRRSRILAEPEDPDAGIVIELKYSQTFSGLQNACERALAQIREKRYDERLRNEGRNNILAYGVAFCKKRCKVAVQRL